MGWWIAFGLLSGLLFWMLIAPLELYIDTTRNRYFLRYLGLARLDLNWHHQELIELQARILGWPARFYPLRKLFDPKKQTTKPPKARKSSQGWRPSWKQVKAAFRAIRVRRLEVNLDTGNWVTNAELYPVFFWMSQLKGNWGVNFEHRNELRLHLHTRPINILKAMFNP